MPKTSTVLDRIGKYRKKMPFIEYISKTEEGIRVKETTDFLLCSVQQAL